MSIIAPPDLIRPVSWRLVYKDGSVCTSRESTWEDQAVPVLLGGVSVSMSVKALIQIEITTPTGVTLLFTPPLPSRLFAFTRLSSCVLGDGEHRTLWLHTLFGYESEQTRSLLIVYLDHLEVRSQLSSDPLFLG